MSKGLGETQRRILMEVEHCDGRNGTSSRPDDWSLTIAELATRLDRSPRQVRTAVHALAKRRLVWVVKTEVGQKWVGECECGADEAHCTCYFQEMPVMGLRVFIPEGRLRQLEEANQERLATGEWWEVQKLIKGREEQP